MSAQLSLAMILRAGRILERVFKAAELDFDDTAVDR